MTFSIITLSYNKLACTRRCLTALIENAVSDAPWELIVVDNGSTDGSADWCGKELKALGHAHGVAVTVLHNSANAGCSRARNQGIAVARGEYLIFIDNDVTPRTRGWMPGLRETLLSVPGAGMVGPKLVYPWPPHPIQCAGVGISRRGHVCFLGRGEPISAPEYNSQRVVQCLISACLMIPAALLRKHGGFDEAFHPVQFEDFDLVYRLRAAGYQAVYTPEVEMYHFESVTTQGSPDVRNAAVVIRNGLKFQQRWRRLFENEDGPPETACRWRDVPAVSFEAIGDLPLT